MHSAKFPSDPARSSSPSQDPWGLLNTDPAELPYLHYRVNGMFTLPEARGQGIAQALIAKIVEYGSSEAAKCGKSFESTIVVDSDNPAARGLYEKCGFVAIKEEAYAADNPRMVILMKYIPKSVSGKLAT